MPLETGTTIANLDEAWPLGSDGVLQGDNHLRLIKAVLKAQFPGALGNGFASVISAKEEEINYLAGVTSNIQAQLNALANDTSMPSHIGMYITINSTQTPTQLSYAGVWSKMPDGNVIQTGTPSPTPVGSNSKTLHSTNIPQMSLSGGMTNTTGGHTHNFILSPSENAANGAAKQGNQDYATGGNLNTSSAGSHNHTVTGTVGNASPASFDIQGARIKAAVWLRTG